MGCFLNLLVARVLGLWGPVKGIYRGTIGFKALGFFKGLGFSRFRVFAVLGCRFEACAPKLRASTQSLRLTGSFASEAWLGQRCL